MASWTLESFQGQTMDDPGMKISTSTPVVHTVSPTQNPRDSVSSADASMQSSSDSTVSLRVYCGDAIMSPGSLYKSVIANATTTALDVIKKTLERYEDTSDPTDFELRYVRFNEKTGKIRKQSGSLTNMLQKSGDKDHILAADECPVLVAEWFTEAPRKFMIFRKRTEVEGTLKKQGSFISRAMKSFRRKSDTESTHVYTVQSPEKETSFSSTREEEEEEDSHSHTSAQATPSPARVQLSKDAVAFGGSVIYREQSDSLAAVPQVDLTRRPSAKFEASL